MTGNELRALYLDFFRDRGHAVVPSASLIPDNDPTTLFTGSGMQPMLPFLLGEPHPLGRRIADAQRCFRVQDIEEVGDTRHTTAFEMLGNWSLGSYFKAEQLTWLWEFLTQVVGLDPHRLFVSVFAGNAVIPRDHEAIAIWQELFARVGLSATVVDDPATVGMGDGRIFAYSGSENWWSRSGAPAKMPVGEPGGPDSEVFFEFVGVAHDPAFGERCHVNCDCGRFLEIGNSVFMQYQKQHDGSFTALPQRNIDFGGGLERLLAAQQDTSDVFETDLLRPIIARVESVSGRPYDGIANAPFRVIADHLKAAVWLLADGVMPSNRAHGYVLRRLVRRAVRFGRDLGIAQPFTVEVARAVQEVYADVNPETLHPSVLEALREEEEKFLATLDRGLREVHRLVDTLDPDAPPALSWVAEQAFDLYQTRGLPIDVFIDDLVLRRQFAYSLAERQEIQAQAERLLAQHQELSRSASAGMFKSGLGGTSAQEVAYHTVTHLLHQALRDVLGAHVQQRGSNITPDRVRFDFTHDARLTPEQIAQVEQIVNEKIAEGVPMSFAIVPLEQARQSGAIGLFAEKYGETVKVYSIGPLPAGASVSATGEDPELAGEVATMLPRSAVYSREFCGGPHVANTGLIRGQFRIQKDERIGRDVVRIRAVVS